MFVWYNKVHLKVLNNETSVPGRLVVFDIAGVTEHL